MNLMGAYVDKRVVMLLKEFPVVNLPDEDFSIVAPSEYISQIIKRNGVDLLVFRVKWSEALRDEHLEVGLGLMLLFFAFVASLALLLLLAGIGLQDVKEVTILGIDVHFSVVTTTEQNVQMVSLSHGHLEELDIVDLVAAVLV